ncbi:helix-turn-helix domain-containing protein [Robbsia andropogonis]|uniref:helix-turn-helix domain-containing protein n=1 Tax=Robbsia andropogonis TaxID=28092 RepID=UPI003D1914E7
MNPKNIIERLLASGLTQKEIEARSGVKQSTVSHIYTGTRGKRTSFDVVSRLHKLLEEIESQQATA